MNKKLKIILLTIPLLLVPSCANAPTETMEPAPVYRGVDELCKTQESVLC